MLWFRRDLRLADHPALLAARDAADEVLPLFVLDDVLRGTVRRAAAGLPVPLPARARGAHRRAAAGADRPAGGGRAAGRPARSAPPACTSAATTRRTAGRATSGCAAALGDVPLVATGSPYGVTPGTLHKADGTPFKVYSPFARAWQARGLHCPALTPRVVPWTDGGLPTDGVPADPDLGGVRAAARPASARRWPAGGTFRRRRASRRTPRRRNRPAADGTSGMSVYLKYGCVHPRTMHAALDGDEGGASSPASSSGATSTPTCCGTRPQSARTELQPQHGARSSTTRARRPTAASSAWATGTTGYPIVDAGMRQLLGEACVHNRVRMIVGVVPAPRTCTCTGGAAPATSCSTCATATWPATSTAGSGSPARAPTRRRTSGSSTRSSRAATTTRTATTSAAGCPSCATLPAKAVHEPWLLPGGPPAGYPLPVVDHAAERQEALRRYAAVKE